MTAIQRTLRREIPEEHCGSNDSRLEWLWMQRSAQVQNIYINTKSPLTRMACALVLSAALAANLPSIELLLRRLEGGAVTDTTIQEGDTLVL